MRIDPTDVARQAAGVADGTLVEWASEPIDNAWGMPITDSIARVRGTLDVDGVRRPFSAVAKALRSIRLFPGFATLPPELQAAAEAAMPWRLELEVYTSGLHDALPPGLRAPRLYAVEMIDDQRATLWLEDVDGAPGPWDASTYAAAARAFGRFAGRYPEGRIPFAFTPMNLDLHTLLDVRIANSTMPVLRDDAIWAHPLVRDTVDPDYRRDVLHLWDRAHRLVDLLANVPRALAHGDACPQNLFIHRTSGGVRFTAIDWGLTGTGPLGSDLVQLVAGRAESGELDAVDVGPIEDAVVPAYLAGLAEEGVAIDPDGLARAYRIQLAVRCGLTALPVERLLGNPPAADDAELRDLFLSRARWGRRLLDLAFE